MFFFFQIERLYCGAYYGTGGLVHTQPELHWGGGMNSLVFIFRLYTVEGTTLSQSPVWGNTSASAFTLTTSLFCQGGQLPDKITNSHQCKFWPNSNLRSAGVQTVHRFSRTTKKSKISHTKSFKWWSLTTWGWRFPFELHPCCKMLINFYIMCHS